MFMNFYLLYGLDKSIINREIDIIKDKLLIKDNDVIYYNIEDINGIVEEALTVSMFSLNKLIITTFGDTNETVILAKLNK